MKSQVFKLQLPVASSHGVIPEMLVYNENRSIKVHIPVTEEIKTLFKGRFKIFALASVKGKDLEIENLVKDPGW